MKNLNKNDNNPNTEYVRLLEITREEWLSNIYEDYTLMWQHDTDMKSDEKIKREQKLKSLFGSGTLIEPQRWVKQRMFRTPDKDWSYGVVIKTEIKSSKGCVTRDPQKIENKNTMPRLIVWFYTNRGNLTWHFATCVKVKNQTAGELSHRPIESSQWATRNS